MSQDRVSNPALKKCPSCGADAEGIQGAEGTQFEGKFKVCCAATNSDHEDEYPLGCPLGSETEWCATESKAAEVWNDRDVYGPETPPREPVNPVQEGRPEPIVLDLQDGRICLSKTTGGMVRLDVEGNHKKIATRYFDESEAAKIKEYLALQFPVEPSQPLQEGDATPVSEAFIHTALACGFVVGPEGLRRVASPAPKEWWIKCDICAGTGGLDANDACWQCIGTGKRIAPFHTPDEAIAGVLHDLVFEQDMHALSTNRPDREAPSIVKYLECAGWKLVREVLPTLEAEAQGPEVKP